MKNPFAQEPQLVQLTIEAPPQVLDVIELMAEDVALAVTRQLEAVSPHLVLITTPQHEQKLEEAAKKIAKQYEAKAVIRKLALEPIDWVRQVQKDFPPFKLGPFYVYGSHGKESVPDHALPLLIEAAAAFGTGEHETTACCLLALAQEKQTRKAPKHVLDMGCGTAILAIGAARLWKNAKLTACDYDAVAVQVSRENFAANHVHGRVFQSDGYRDARVGKFQYDVIVANILARPLMKMAHAAVKHLAPGGTLILSGLLVRQEMLVLSAYRAQGLYLHSRLRRGRWSALILKKN